jgi:predicted Zn finger-like uncharacterized protein
MAIHCPNCLQSFRARDDLLGKRVTCPKCKERFTVPGKAEVTASEQKPPYDPAQEETAQPIPLDTSVLHLIKANRFVYIGALLPLFLLLTQGGFSQTTVMVLGACLLVFLGGLLGNVYYHKGCWIRFGRNDMTFKTKGKEHKYNVADLVSIHCPTAAQRHFLDFVHLKFRSGPKVRLSIHSPGFEEAKDELLMLLARSGSIKDCVVVGDFEFPTRVAATAETLAEPQEDQSQEALATQFRSSNLAARESRWFAAIIDV